MISLIFIPGAWHEPTCYRKTIKILEEKYKIRCIGVTLPSTQYDPSATFKDDIDAARAAIIAETLDQCNAVIVISHSYGGMVGNSAIKGLTPPKTAPPAHQHQGYVRGLILIASGFTITGLSFMDPFFGHPPPAWRVNKETGFAELVTPPRELFYHDVPEEEARQYVSELTSQSLKALFEGSEHAYAGWRDVPSGAVWYIGTSQDRGMPVIAQRLNVGLARGSGTVVNHVELASSHSPFISMPEETADIIVDAVERVSTKLGQSNVIVARDRKGNPKVNDFPFAAWTGPMTWLQFGMPLLLGRMLGLGLYGFLALRLWSRKLLEGNSDH